MGCTQEEGAYVCSPPITCFSAEGAWEGCEAMAQRVEGRATLGRLGAWVGRSSLGLCPVSQVQSSQ